MDNQPPLPGLDDSRPASAPENEDRGTFSARGRRVISWLTGRPTEDTSATLWAEYVLVTVVLAAITLVSIPLPEDYYHGLGFVYLLAVILLSLRVGRGPALWAGFLSVAAWDFVFIPNHFSFVVEKLSDALLLGPYFVVSLVLGQITVWIRDEARVEHLREERATALFQLTRALLGPGTLDEASANALRQVDELLGSQTALALVNESSGALVAHPASTYPLDSPELTAAVAAMHLRRPAGRFTDTLLGRMGYYIPLLREDRVLGVLGVKVPARVALTARQRDLLDVFVRQLALIVEREHLQAASEREKVLAQSAKLHRTLLESVSHELRTPLAVITAAVENLAEAEPSLRANLIREARTAARRLNRTVSNLLDQTRLESGALKPRLDWCDARDIINAAVESTRETLADHPLTVVVPDEFSPVRADFALTEQALGNLLINAAQHTPPGTAVSITAGLDAGRRVKFAVADRGAGIAPAMRARIFQKFARGEEARAGGLGLGLSLVRGFIVAQGGEVVVSDNPGGGAVITLYLPHASPKNPPPE